MPKKFICKLSTEELKRLYIDEKRTLDDMCKILGVHNRITASKVLNEHGISTNANARKADIVKQGRTDEEFKRFLVEKYSSGESMGRIGEEIGITPSAVRKYFVKYGIERRKNTEFFDGNPSAHPSWSGGVRRKQSGYIEIYAPEHPNANKRKCVYEHQLVMESHIGRYLRKGEVVHHIDQNKSNNDISNLLLMTNEEHTQLHALLRKGEKRTNRKKG